MTITQLEYILAVDKFRHFNKAAKSCSITQPTLSMQIQKLEDELGIIIFDRSKNPILPTTEGEAVLKQARVSIKEFYRIFDVLKAQGEKLEGDFKLAVIPTLAPYIIPLFLGEFVSKYPAVNLIIEESKTEDIIESLSNDEIDAGILVTPLHDDSLIERVLYYEPFYVFAAANHSYAKKSKIKECELSDEDVWLLKEGHCFRDQVLKLCSLKKKAESTNLTFESGNLETLKNMVLKGGGYTLLPQMAVQYLPPNHKKLVKEFHNPVPTREVSIVYSRSFLKERIINAVEEEILNALPKNISSHKVKNMDVVEIF